MTLSETDIWSHLIDGALSITRDDGSIQVEPSSVDLHLGETMLTFGRQTRSHTVNVAQGDSYPDAMEVDDLTIPPQSFRLATTQERVELPEDLVGFLWGRSSVGRLGLFVHNAGLIDAGFRGDLTLELYNAAPYPIELEAGMRIVQMTLHEHDSPPETPYGDGRGSKYNDQRGPTPSRLSEDFSESEADR